jgi:dUTP pyrophosphatase
MKVRVKKLHPGAVVPKYAKPGDAGLDLTAISKEYDAANDLVVFGTGLAVEIPEGYVGLIFPRSSICKTPLILSNSVGVIDSGYRGEIKFMFRPIDRPRKNYEVGDRIGQLIIMPFPQVELVEAEELSSSERGTGGFGSSGK